mmetsp:Transcript_21694/g.73756  ORF Transcript_21694/g.73756 Transcript_21694/m.73756 type:complete len:227 (+) Transcript_21694:397-1077(+)
MRIRQRRRRGRHGARPEAPHGRAPRPAPLRRVQQRGPRGGGGQRAQGRARAGVQPVLCRGARRGAVHDAQPQGAQGVRPQPRRELLPHRPLGLRHARQDGGRSRHGEDWRVRGEDIPRVRVRGARVQPQREQGARGPGREVRAARRAVRQERRHLHARAPRARDIPHHRRGQDCAHEEGCHGDKHLARWPAGHQGRHRRPQVGRHRVPGPRRVRGGGRPVLHGPLW